MNKKSKNKKGKIPNPVPLQEEQPVGAIEDVEVIGDRTPDYHPEKLSETVENVEGKIKSVKEERVPEIVSEIIMPLVETKDEETPKKPKRNRGKKKKGKEDDFDDNIEETPKEGAAPSYSEDSKIDVLENEKQPLDMPVVTPTARKKKNKKKNVENKLEEPNIPVAEQAVIPVITKDVIDDLRVTEIKQETITQPEAVETEVKSSKKKNKKKKRNDSEKSDKEEISCTSAFQKLMEASEESVEIKTEENIEDVVSVEGLKTETEILPQIEPLIQDIIIEKETAKPMESALSKEDEHQQVSVLESKSKKKNKKDKKHIPKPEDSAPMLDQPIIQSPTAPMNVEILTENIAKDVSRDSVTLGISEIQAEEMSPKPKAKIAKPVEKKRKGKQDNQASEGMTEDTIIPEAMKLEQPAPIALENPEVNLPEKKLICENEIKNIQQDIPIDITASLTPSLDVSKSISLEEFKPLDISDKAIGKKRKKGPKIPKTPDVSFEILEPNVEITKQLDIEISSKPPIASDNMNIKEPEVSTASQLSKVPIIIDAPIPKPTLEPITQIGVKEHVLLTPETTQETDPMKIEIMIPEKIEDEPKFEVKSSKKRKKSPKPHKKDNIILTTEEPVPQTPKPFEEELLKPEPIKEMGGTIDASNITRMYDIEISSIKVDESEETICDPVPDITYPRASSQQLLDDNNNNTIIREIFPVQELLTDIPVQERSISPKVEITSKKKEEVSPPKEEKTDLKSKMMEVNQDMEELRLSIERSLAELTAIEKSEEVVEKQFEQSQMKAEDFKTMDLGLGQQKDEIVKPIAVSEEGICFIDKPTQEIKTAEADITDSKNQEEALLLPGVNLQSIQEKIIPEDLTPKEPEPVKEVVSTLQEEIKSADIVAEEVKSVPAIVDTKLDLVTPITVEKKATEISLSSAKGVEGKALNEKAATVAPIPLTLPEEKKTDQLELVEEKFIAVKPKEEPQQEPPPVCPARKDNKGKHKKRKGKQDSQVTSQQSTQSAQSTATSQSSTATTTKETKKEDKTDSKTENKGSKDTKGKGKQQAGNFDPVTEKDLFSDKDYEPIENFEDALTSSVDDVNKTFEMIVKESQEQTNPKINIIAPDEEKTPVSPPKNLLGHPDIPVQSSRRDYKKEKDKIPNEITAKVKIKDAVDVEKKQSKNTQTICKIKDLKDCRLSDNEEFVYKYSFRKVFLQSLCHLCKKDLAGARVPCCYCNLVFYCGMKHKDEDWPQHQALCFAVSTIGHLKDQKHIYADAKNLTGHDYRLIRMQMIVSCEKVLKRRLVPWEQEALLYPRVCSHVPCREWRQFKLSDCQGCGQISYCTEHPDHYPKSHSRWCKSYDLYQKLVCYQQTKGRLEPRLPSKIMKEQYEIPEKINEVLAAMYEEKIDMNDIQYAALTQQATAPLTAAYCHQLWRSKNIAPNGFKNTTFTIHVVGAELQFEADALNKWEVFFLHLRPDLQELKVVLINYNLNPSNLPLELLGKIKLCDNCRQNKRRVIFSFQDKRTYADYKSSEDFTVPDIVCAFNPSIQRSSVYNGKDPWPSTVNVILKQKIPFILTAYTITELHKDCIRIKECSETGYNFILEPKFNNFASVRPDRNFISDDEMPLLFKNYCFAIICG